jgi:hypothetical protein
LYWFTDEGLISYQSCLKLDCEPTTLTYATLVTYPSTFAVDGRQVYWTSGSGTLYSCPAEGCAAEPVLVTLDPALRLRDTIFAQREYVYWSSDVDLYRCPASGCGATPEVVAPSAGSDELVFDETRAFWLAESSIFSVASDGSGPRQIVIGLAQGTELPGEGAPPDQPQGLAVGGGYLYWATGKQVFRCPVANCSAAGPTLLATGDAAISALKIDSTAMYWLEADSIHSCPLAGCEQSSVLTPAKLVHRLPESRRYAMDATDLYWLEASDEPGKPTSGTVFGGVIRKTAK